MTKKPEITIRVGAIFFAPEGKTNDLSSNAPGVFGYILRDNKELDEEILQDFFRALWKFGFDGGLAGHV